MLHKLVILFTILFFGVILYTTGLLTFGGLCGYQPGHLAKVKEGGWKCVCGGIVQNESTSYSESQFCTGINFSHNRITQLLGGYTNSVSRL